MAVGIAEMRRHWRSRSLPCNLARDARDVLYRDYLNRAAETGRRWRGRALSRSNQALCEARTHCWWCQQNITWENGHVTPSRYGVRAAKRGLSAPEPPWGLPPEALAVSSFDLWVWNRYGPLVKKTIAVYARDDQ